MLIRFFKGYFFYSFFVQFQSNFMKRMLILEGRGGGGVTSYYLFWWSSKFKIMNVSWFYLEEGHAPAKNSEQEAQGQGSC